MKHEIARGFAEGFPAYACTAERIAKLFGIPEPVLHLYADNDMLPRLTGNRFDCVWLLNLAVGQQIAGSRRRVLPATAAVVLGWLDTVGDDLEADDVRAFLAVFERNGYTRRDFNMALDEALAFCDEQAKTHTCN
ncbi:hypothetical protein [Paraburkholderia sp. SUR17]|uniref:hypothetical protein n=1 Tax=Paraburkholderia sp. SUR17 TaxID=3034358 RepID=UPI002407B7D1|nr:hypothetical protein [Paraburkholderia sp. SUR17]WEY37780.1 hypothetical protein P2869_11905 [Paraburkholderia sp. SUR17]